MDTELLEKSRIVDENEAQAVASDALKERTSLHQKLRSLKERMALALELKAKQQAALISKQINELSRSYALKHENPYPEVTKDEARMAMCEPVRNKLSKFQEHALEDALNLFNPPIHKANPLEFAAELDHYFKVMSGDPLTPGSLLLVRESEYSQRTGTRSLGRNFKYDLACEVLSMEDLDTYGEETEVLLPMAALCRLKEAKAKNMFNWFEVWRPSDWKAPDPWLVGVAQYRAESEVIVNRHYFKVCDWR